MVFEAVRLTAQKCAFEGRQAEPEELRRLDHRERVVLGLFASKETVTAPQVAAELGLSERMARNLLTDWVRDGWLEVADPSRRARSYSLKRTTNSEDSNYFEYCIIEQLRHRALCCPWLGL